MRISSEKFYTQLSTVPKTARELAGSEKLDQFLNNLKTQHSLSGEQIRELGYLANYTILDLIATDALQNLIQKELTVTDNVAQNIFNSFSKEILSHLAPEESTTNRAGAGVENDSNPSPQQPPAEEEKPLLEHLAHFEKRKQEKKEKENQPQIPNQQPPSQQPQPPRPAPQQEEPNKGQQTAAIPPNLPVATEDIVEDYIEHTEKNRPSGPDPYREPIE